jgi:hypothetical protein
MPDKEPRPQYTIAMSTIHADERVHPRAVSVAQYREDMERSDQFPPPVVLKDEDDASHGMRRTNEEKRAAVKTLVMDEAWGKWSDREIARRCRVDGKLVAKLREQLKPVTAETRSERTYTTKHGTTISLQAETLIVSEVW